MKVLGFVIIVVGFVMVWVGVTGNQHNLMATLTGKANAAQSGLPINPTGGTSSDSNSPPVQTA